MPLSCPKAEGNRQELGRSIRSMTEDASKIFKTKKIYHKVTSPLLNPFCVDQPKSGPTVGHPKNLKLFCLESRNTKIDRFTTVSDSILESEATSTASLFEFLNARVFQMFS